MKITIPYISTKIETDLLVTLLLTPLWWVLGAGIFVYQFVAILVFLKLLTRLITDQRPFRIPFSSVWLACFLLAFFLSIVINAPNHPSQRVMASFNNWIVFLMGWMITMGAYECPLEEWIKDLCRVAKWLSLASGVIAIFFIFLWYHGNQGIEWPTVLSKVFPALNRYPFFFNLLTVRITAVDFMAENFPRVTIYSGVTTASGGFMLMILPLAMAHLKLEERFQASSLLACILGFVPLIFSLSRTAICAFMAAWLFVWFLERKGKIFWAFFFLIVTFLASGLLYDGFQWLLNSRSSSTTGRLDLYEDAIRIALQENWLLGIGVRLREGFTLMSVGSHSTYVGLFLMTGFLGFLFFVLFQFSFFAGWFQIRMQLQQKEHRIFWRYLGMSALAVNIWVLTDSLEALPFIAYTYFLIASSMMLLTQAVKNP